MATWNVSPSGNAAGYFLYIGNASRQYNVKVNVGRNTQFTIRGLPNSQRYFFAVTAFNAAHVESPFSNEASVYVPVGAEPLGTTVVEYYEPYLDHYFMTADPTEQTAIESGEFGWWRRTGHTFNSGGPVSVCRFHGNPAIDPSTELPYGPNTYFYTADMSTCVFLSMVFDYTAAGRGMVFDRFDFFTTAATNHTCPPYLAPVYRAYNNGYALGFDANHRYSTDRSAIQEVVARGWRDEGIVLCAPP